jgi:hypothetical protein
MDKLLDKSGLEGINSFSKVSLLLLGWLFGLLKNRVAAFDEVELRKNGHERAAYNGNMVPRQIWIRRNNFIFEGQFVAHWVVPWLFGLLKNR